MDRLDAAYRYLDDGRPECKVVGIMIINSVFGTDGTRSELSTIVGRALELTGVQFILRMITTGLDSDNNDSRVSSAGLEFALIACSCSDFAANFFKHLPEMLVLAEELANHPVLEQYTALIVLVATSSRERWRAVVEALLEKLAVGARSSGCYLKVFTEVAVARCDGDESHLELTREKAGILRSVIIRGLHGAAPQAQRDATLLALGNLLSSRPQPQTELLALSPSWTVASSKSKEQRAGDDGEDAKREAPGAFAQVLCAVVRGELQLLCDEALFLASSTPDAVAERFALEVPARPRPAAPAAAPSGYGKVADTDSAQALGGIAPALTPAAVPPGSPNPANDVAYFQGRASRTVAVFCTCLRLLEAFLELLIGSSGGVPSEQGQGQEPAWAGLPTEALMQIKRSLYGSIDDLFTFVKDCGELLAAGGLRGEDHSHFLTAAALTSLLCCAEDALAAFVVQDAQLAATYINHLPSLLKTSHLRLHVDGSVELGGGVKEEELARLVGALGEGAEDLKARLSERAAYRPGLAVGPEAGQPDDTPCEVVLHTVRALQELADDALLQAEGGLSVESTALERLCDYMPQLLPRMLYLVHVSVVHLQALGATAKDAHLLLGAADLCRAFVALVGVYESRHSGELAILRGQEGDQAVLAALGVDLRRHRDTAAALNALHTQLQSAKERKTQDFEHCLAAFQNFACVFEHSLP